MPFVYGAVDSLQGKPPAGNGDCVDLVKTFTPGLMGRPTSTWKPGALVIESPNLTRGTAIATFVDGKYPHADTGQHAAFFLKHAGSGFWVMDQWREDKKKPRISKRLIARALPDGINNSLSNDAAAFSVIETK